MPCVSVASLVSRKTSLMQEAHIQARCCMYMLSGMFDAENSAKLSQANRWGNACK